MTQSMRSTEHIGHTWSAFPACHEMLPRKQPPPQRPIKFWLPCIRDLRPRSMPNYSNPWHRFRTAPGDYQSTPPNFPPEPQFTHWSRVTPFALERARQFRPGPPPALTSDAYSDAFNQIKSLGIANSTTATADEA